MPRFATNGPDIPEGLLYQHEEGRVVFFCGAGISYPAGLPDFRGLVDQIYAELGTERNPIEAQAYSKNQYDATLDLLERRYPGQRLAVRTALAHVLKPKWRRKASTATHEALLQLATDRNGKIRLVTTNFDRIFQRVITRHSTNIPCFSAPLLPIPKPSRWHGVVHLHGLLPDPIDETELNRLVLTSGDFGLAYLTERWAARFVSELFRYYTVCFVGYSINDPVLRYMMDALAVDEMLGEMRPQAYAFGSYEDERERQTMLEWEAKGVKPLLYKVLGNSHDHSSLHLTLKEWSDTYRDGVRGKEMIIVQHASAPPLTSSRLDYAVGRVLWALTDGLAAKHFADLSPVPPLKWLEPLSENQFKHDDLQRFGVMPDAENDGKLVFSVVRRPSPYMRAPQMCLVDFGAQQTAWDDRMVHLGRWLSRHLDDPKLLLWLAKQGGHLHDHFAMLVKDKLKTIDQLTADAKNEELDRIRAAAPNAIPRPLMRVLWRLFLSGRIKSHTYTSDLYEWLRRFKAEGLTPSLRIELRQILSPRVSLREPFQWKDEDDESEETLRDLVDFDIVLSADHVHSILSGLEKFPIWPLALPDLLLDFTLLLRDALDLMREMDRANDKSDLSYIHHPSISAHTQNRDFRDWTALIDLTRDAWVAMIQRSTTLARGAAEVWWQIPYPLFKRLSFFAGTYPDVISPAQGLDWLLTDNNWWLWSNETERESIRLLVSIAPRLDTHNMERLERAILQGPPREMYRDDVEPERWTRLVNREVWLRLEKVQNAGAALGEEATGKMISISHEFPDWQLAVDESDEFPYWMGEGEKIGQRFAALPSSRRDVVAWLKQHPSSDRHWQEDDWRQRCRDDFPTTACALLALTLEGQWPADRWREAIQAWAEEKLVKRSWRYMARVIAKAPDEIIQKLEHSLSSWLQAQAKLFLGQEELFFGLILRLLKLQGQNPQTGDDDPVSRAINHPVGHVTEALLTWWYRQEPKVAQSLPNEIKPIFIQLCDTKIGIYRHGRVILAAHTIALFRVDEEWARVFLLPLFDWHTSTVEARAAWEGFLWSPRLYAPLLLAIKQPMLETALHYTELGRHADQFASFLTFAALDPGEIFTTEELSRATRSLPLQGLQHTAQTLVRALEGAGQQRSEYWRNRVLPYFKSVWPKTQEVISPALSENFARLCTAAREAFPEAFNKLRHWLRPVDHPDYLISQMSELDLCSNYPTEALEYLAAVIGDDAQWLPQELRDCLDKIEDAKPELTKSPKYRRLDELLKRRGLA